MSLHVSTGMVSSALLNWCNVSGVSSGLVYRQLCDLRALFRNSSDIKDMMVSLHSNVNRTLSQNGSVARAIESSGVLYDPVASIVNFILTSKDGLKAMDNIHFAFGLKIGVKIVKLVVSKPIADTVRDKAFNEIYELFDHRVDFSIEVDNGLLDGWVLFCDFIKIDRSVKCKLNGLLSLVQLS